MKRKGEDIIQESFADINLRQLSHVPIIAVYKSPTDYPGKFVARLWDIGNRPTQYIMVKQNLEEVRRNIPCSMCRLERSQMDDPVVVETWI